MAKHTDRLTRAARDRLLRLERQNKAREEARAVAAGVDETVSLSKARGAELVEPKATKRQDRATPYRRLSGLEWLRKRDRITEDQMIAGKRYGATYRKAMPDVRIRSILDREPTGGEGCTIAHILADSEERVYAADKLAMYRRQLANQKALIDACDAICGEEQTPREAAANGRGAESIEALLVVALDLLNLHVAPRRMAQPQDVDRAA